MILYGMNKLQNKVEYKRWKHLNAFADTFFILGFTVLIGDLMWVTGSGLRFAWYYPFYPDVWQVILCALRDAVGIAFCFILIRPFFKQNLIHIGKSTVIALCGFAAFLMVSFLTCTTPADSDWTFAIRYGFPIETILVSFVGRYLLGKVFGAWIYLSIWKFAHRRLFS